MTLRVLDQWLCTWLAKRLRAFVELNDPLTAPAIAKQHGPSPRPGISRFQVLRWGYGREWSLYDGPSGAEARKWFAHVKTHKEVGRMEFWQDDVMRDSYIGPAA